MINIFYLFLLYLIIILFFYLLNKLELKYLIFLPLLIGIIVYGLKKYIILEQIKNYKFQGKYLLLDLFLIFLINKFNIKNYYFFISKLNIFLQKIEDLDINLHNEKNEILEHFINLLKTNNINIKYNKYFNNIILNIYDNYKKDIFNKKEYIAYDISTYIH